MGVIGSTIQLDGVAMTYGRHRVLHGIDASFAGGDVVALLGHNGAGKTTLLRLLACQALPTRGSVHIHGLDTRRERGKILQSVGTSLYPERSFYFRLTVEQNLRYFQALNGLFGSVARQERTELLEQLGMAALTGRKFMELSLGQRSRLGIARALIGAPRVILLDEPFANLDDQGRGDVARIIARLRDNGATVVFTTHALDDVRNEVTQVATVSEGGLMLSTPGIGGTGEPLRKIIVNVSSKGSVDLSRVMARWRCELDENQLNLEVPVDLPSWQVIQSIEMCGVAIEAFEDQPWATIGERK